MNNSLHIRNARIWTGDTSRPWAGSVTVVDGRITALDAPESEGLATLIIDAKGRTFTPGLIDAHLHVLSGGASLNRLDLSRVRCREEFEAAIADRHRQLPPGQWLLANGWSQENWGGAPPDKHWLRAAGGGGERPVVCYRMDMHVVLVNEAVLRLCDLSHTPPGGEIVRDANGEPTGVLVEAAAWRLVNPIVPQPSVEEKRHNLRQAQQHLHSLGITAVGPMEYGRDVADVYEPLRDHLTLRCRITLLDRDWPLDFTFGRSFHSDDQLGINGYKTFIDGTLGSRTARMLRAYADDPGNRGLLVELARDGLLCEWIRAVAEHGFSPSMHAIGDEAARMALDAIDAAGIDARPRVEHAQQVDPSDVPRFAGRIASMQPLHKADDCRYVRRRLGDERLAGTFAFRKLRNAGAILAFGSDWPVVSPDPILGMRTAITGALLDGSGGGALFAPEENLTVEETLRAYTSDAAYALGMSGAGTLKVGGPADLVMFDRDPFTVDWLREPPRVVLTIAGGRVVYDALSHASTQEESAKRQSPSTAHAP